MNATSCIPSKVSGPLGQQLLELLGLSASSLMSVVIPMEVTLGAGTAADSVDYDVPTEYDLVVWGFRSSYRSSNLSTEPALNANITAFSVEGLAEARLSNILAELSVKERKLDVVEGQSLNLATAYRHPVRWDVPLIIPGGKTLTLTATAQSVVAANIGNDADYGIVLEAMLIPKS